MYDTNPYYNPENLGLTPVAEIDYSDGNYQFDLRVVWQHEDGNLYTARDSGCSCPSPFEDYNSVESLERFDYDSVYNEAVSEASNRYSDVTPNELADFLADIRALRLNG